VKFMTEIIEDGMVIDPQIQNEIAHRATDLGTKIGNQPDEAIHSLGQMTLPNGSNVNVWMRHAVDAVAIDTDDNIVLILRGHNPGKGKLATPGGFVDPVHDKIGPAVAENSINAALRELSEETTFSKEALKGAEVTPVGDRKFDRPFDIREAWNDISDTPIKKGDFFIVSTQAFLIQTRVGLKDCGLKEADDATGLKILNVRDLKKEDFGVEDHFDMIQRALPNGPRAPSSHETNTKSPIIPQP
jgi:hypothetical protein